ncbi:hypothetical protein Taro_022878, partial [Colocasia esculenta]|nr:hypothetical protein [Colocasia esculenta]
QELGINALAAKISSLHPAMLPSNPLNGQRLPLSSSGQNNELFFLPWLREVGVAERRPVRTSRDVRSRRSSSPRHCRVLYFPHRRLWIMECSCKVWCRPCRRRPTPRLHSRLSWRLRNNTQDTAELFSFGRVKEEKLKPSSPSAARGDHTSAILILLGHRGSMRSTGNPIIANESSATSASVWEIQRSAGDGAETRRPQLFSGDHGGTASATVVSVRPASTSVVVYLLLASVDIAVYCF